jgi:Fe2+ or Zn2+ uptake regulation protein
MWTKTWNYGQKHDIVDKNFESTYEHLSEPRNVHTIFSGKCGQKHEIMDKKNEIMDKNMKYTF